MIERCSPQERLRFDEASLERFLSQQAAFFLSSPNCLVEVLRHQLHQKKTPSPTVWGQLYVDIHKYIGNWLVIMTCSITVSIRMHTNLGALILLSRAYLASKREPSRWGNLVMVSKGGPVSDRDTTCDLADSACIKTRPGCLCVYSYIVC